MYLCINAANSSLVIPHFLWEPSPMSEDQDGNPFVYNARKNATFGSGSSYFTLSAVNGTSLEMDLYDAILLTYELHNANPYGSVTFNFTTEPVDGFIKFLWPYQATVGAGGSVQVIITASAGSLRIRRGSSHTFTVTATNGCMTLSASKTVNIRAPVSLRLVHTSRNAKTNIVTTFLSTRPLQPLHLLCVAARMEEPALS